MKIKEILKKCMWGLLVLLLTYLMIQAGKDASDNIWIEGDPTFHYYVALSWEILKGIAAILPVWLLSLLGLARSCFGENWFPFAEKIPVRVTKSVMATTAILWAGVAVAGAIYLEQTQDSYAIRYRMENRFDGWRTTFALILFYGILLYIEQWSIQRNCSRQNIRKKQALITVTLFLTLLIQYSVGGVKLWYIPLSYVDSLNRLEDYFLWWFSLYIAVAILPLWFFSARKTVRVFKDNAHWLTLSSIIPKKITALIALVATGLMVWQIQESRSDRALIPSFDVPEYLEAAATGHTFQALIWGMALFYALCLLVKQLRAARRTKREQ